VQANIVVPVLQPGELWGLLIAHHCSQPRLWTEGEIQLLRQLADQVAIAIQQANLYQQTQNELAERQRAEAALQQLNQELEQRVQRRTQALQRQAEQEHLLRLIIQNIHQSLDLDDIFSTVLHATRKTLKADRVAIYQFNSDWSGQFVAESVGEGWNALVGGDGVQSVWQDSYLKDTQGGRYKNNETFAVHDIYEAGHDPCHIKLLEQFQARAYAIVPIILDNQLWGLLAAYQNTGPRQWQDWEVSLLHQISIQTAIALRQSLLYQASREQVTELEKLHQLKDDFLSTVSHELRSPLANIKMAIQMLDISLTQPELQLDRLTHYLQILEEECNQELALVNDLLDLQRLETGRHPLDMEQLDLTHWVSSVAESFQVRAQQQQQHLRIQISPHLPPIETDPDCLKRIVMELLHNACKYTPPQESITVTAQERDQMLQIQVCNSGVEIPADKLPCIFEKFYRITGADRWKHGGTGLGLALVKCLVEHLGGAITATSTNALTCFTIQLPLSVQEVTSYSALAEGAGGLSSAT
jgi:signal transduction histidine kinase